MNNTKDTIQAIFDRWFSGQLSATDIEQLNLLSTDPQFDTCLPAELQRQWENIKHSDEFSAAQAKQLGQAILGAKPVVTPPMKVVHRAPFMREWGWAAAAVLFIALTITYFLLKSDQKQPLISDSNPLQEDFLPGRESAILTLADGSTIKLDSASNGAIAQQGNTYVTKLEDGQIAYAINGKPNEEVKLNTMATPNGGQYRLQLPDGTMVWINAASSVTFPASFSAKERTITVSGEVYMEVAQKKNWPFIVKTANSMIIVLGTAFNINAYAEEHVHRTTLVQGAIKMKVNAKEVVLLPGQQAVVDNKGVMEVSPADIDQQLAWKNGFINFEDKSLEEAMRELARWYNVKVEYPKGVPAVKLGGEIRRNISIQSMISSLNALRIHAYIDGNKIIVLPK